jgi:hypothetical protein
VTPHLLEQEIVAYFVAEKRESLVFVIVGLAALLLAAALWRSSHPLRGMLFPLAALGAVELVVGGAVLARTDRQVAALTVELRRDPAALKAHEVPRMERVIAGFRAYRGIELVLLAAGAGLLLAFAYPSLSHGAGVGLVAQGALLLVLDAFAAGRGQAYLAALRQLSA